MSTNKINFHWKDRRLTTPKDDSAVITYSSESGLLCAHYEDGIFSSHPCDGGESVDYIRYWAYEEELYPVGKEQ